MCDYRNFCHASEQAAVRCRHTQEFGCLCRFYPPPPPKFIASAASVCGLFWSLALSSNYLHRLPMIFNLSSYQIQTNGVSFSAIILNLPIIADSNIYTPHAHWRFMVLINSTHLYFLTASLHSPLSLLFIKSYPLYISCLLHLYHLVYWCFSIYLCISIFNQQIYYINDFPS